MKKLLSLLLVVTFVLPLSLMPFSSLAVGPEGMLGSGTEADPYQITNQVQLQAIGESWMLDKHYILMNDITLQNPSDPENTFVPIGGIYAGSPSSYEMPFKGTFNGNYKVIKNLRINNEISSSKALFGLLVGGKIYNLGVEDSLVIGKIYSSAILVATASNNSEITNCYVKNSTITGNSYIGLLLGQINGTKITYCFTDGIINGSVFCGGLVGSGQSGNITNSYSNTEINCSQPNATSSYCENGALVGMVYLGTITNCYATGNAYSRSAAGGLVGATNNSNIRNSVSLTNNVDVEKDGGRIAGYIYTHMGATNFKDNYALETMLVSGSIIPANLTGPNSQHGLNKSLAQLQMQETYESLGWDFTNIWYMGQDLRPHLRMEKMFPGYELEIGEDPQPDPDPQGANIKDADVNLLANTTDYTYRFKDTYNFNHVFIKEKGNHITGYQLQYLRPGTTNTWQTFYTGTTLGDGVEVTINNFDTITAAGIRLNVTGANNMDAVLLYDFEVRYMDSTPVIPPGVNINGVAYRASATATTSHPTTPVELALDDDFTTRWSSGGTTSPITIEVRYNGTYQFDKVVLREYWSRISGYTLQYLTPGTEDNWQTFHTGATLGNGTDVEISGFGTISADGARIIMDRADTSLAISLYEFQVLSPQ